MDRRQQKTRKAIFEAFTRLLERKSYGNITVQDIIDEANIGRSTFYSHFTAKEDLLKSLCTDIFDHVFSEELMKEKTHDFSEAEGSMKQKITHILYHLYDSRSFLKRLLSGENGEIFMRYFKQYLTQVFESSLTKNDSDIPMDYMLNHTVCDLAETVRWWLKKDKYSPEEIAEFYMATTPYFG